MAEDESSVPRDSARSVLLVAFDVHRRPSAAQPGGIADEFRQPGFDRSTLGSLIFYDLTGFPASSHTIFQRRPTIQTLFGEPTQVAAVWSHGSSSYRIRTAAFAVSVAQAQHLIRGDYEAASVFDAIIKNILPPEPDRRVFPRLAGCEYGKFVCYEVHRSVGHPLDLLQDALTFVGAETHYILPVVVDDLLLLQAGYGSGFEAHTAVWLNRANKLPADAVILPDTVRMLIEAIAAESSLNDLADRLRELPTSAMPVVEYIASASKHEKPLHHYLVSHIRDRERSAIETVTAEEHIEEVRAALRENVVTLSEAVPIPVPGLAPRAYNPFRYIQLRLTSAETLASAAVRAVQRRDAVITEHLRDYVTAAVAASNLAVQRFVTWLTVLALVLGVCAIAQGFMPEEVKQAIWNSVVAQFR